MTNKPPIELIPKEFYERQKRIERIIDIRKAIIRYTNNIQEIPEEWITEYNELVQEENES